jgi:hypothetical protein
MKLSIIRPALLAAMALIAATVSAQTLNPNQTLGYGENKLLKFTYTQNLTASINPTTTSTSMASSLPMTPTKCRSQFARSARIPRSTLRDR